ncbi:hypothetical protein CTAYLR_008259 [Chrysophaeum taylorii]|uniref:Ankyrin repeat protein n=1 Tax=Chrysophaeum taylorii TaxID=2483200 RepID=A0AAD7XG90_9STRA|nr:hypothetical protein CTAYLR_008259 [Chrysophaeum taylorii]
MMDILDSYLFAKYGPPYSDGVSLRNLRLCKMLVRAGADPQHVNELGQSSLSTACGPRARLELVEFLLDNGADVNHVDKAGHAPLDLVGEIWI